MRGDATREDDAERLAGLYLKTKNAGGIKEEPQSPFGEGGGVSLTEGRAAV